MGLAFVPLYIKDIGIEPYGLIGVFAIIYSIAGLCYLTKNQRDEQISFYRTLVTQSVGTIMSVQNLWERACSRYR